MVFKKKRLYLYPNPTENILTVYCKGAVNVLDMRGVTLRLPQTVFEDRVIIDTTMLQKGNYLLVSGENIEKFIKL